MSDGNWECIDGVWVNTENGEVSEDFCFEPTDLTQDKELVHYSATPPVPYVPEKYRERMKELNKWVKGRERWLEMKERFYKKLEWVINTYGVNE